MLFNILLEAALDRCEIGAGLLDTVIWNVCFADHISLLTDSEHKLQHLLNSQFGMRISNFNTEAQCTDKDSKQMDEFVSSSALRQLEVFVYLTGTISADSNCYKDVMTRIGLTTHIVRKRYGMQMTLSKKTKVCLYQSLVQSLLMYNANVERRAQVEENEGV